MTSPIIAHGSTSPTKVAAVRKVIASRYPDGFEISHLNAVSGVSRQPRGLEETIRGAKSRALDAYINKGECDFAIGIESGLIELPGSESGMMELCICAVFDGTHYCIGASSGFEVPVPVMKAIVHDGCSLTQAFTQTGFIGGTHNHGESGIIDGLTENRMTREMQNEQALTMAFVKLDNPRLYK